MNIHTQLCTVAHRSMWYFHELKIALLPSYNMIKKNLKNKYIKIRRKIENNTRRYIEIIFFLNSTDKEIESKKKKKKMIELNFKRF